jgi:hypothetical protein
MENEFETYNKAKYERLHAKQKVSWEKWEQKRKSKIKFAVNYGLIWGSIYYIFGLKIIPYLFGDHKTFNIYESLGGLTICIILFFFLGLWAYKQREIRYNDYINRKKDEDENLSLNL